MFHKWAAELTLLTCVLPMAAICNTKPSVCCYSWINGSFTTQNVEVSARGFMSSGESGEHKYRIENGACCNATEDKKTCHFWVPALPFPRVPRLSSWVKCPLLPSSREPEKEGGGGEEVKAIYMWHTGFDSFVTASGAKPDALKKYAPPLHTYLQTHGRGHVRVDHLHGKQRDLASASCPWFVFVWHGATARWCRG